jgi:cytochrome c-type biogenesis protein CcmF
LLLGYVTVREYFLGARGARRASGGGWAAAFVGLFERDRRRYGGYLVHLGIAVMAVAIVGSNIYQLQVRRTVAPGESFEVGDYTITYEDLRRRPGTANGVESETVAVLRVTEGDTEVARLEPGRRTFRNFPGQPMAIVAVETRLLEDLYVFVQGWDENGVAEFNAFVNPLMLWLWVGAAVYTFGGVIAFAPAPARAPVRRELPAGATQRA